MLMTRRKRKEGREVEVYLNNKLLQVKTMKCLGIIIDKELTFREHITQATEECRKLIFTLARSAKLNSALSHKALRTLYTEECSRSFYTGTGLGRKSRKDAIQQNANWSTMANKHEDSKNLQIGVQ